MNKVLDGYKKDVDTFIHRINEDGMTDIEKDAVDTILGKIDVLIMENMNEDNVNSLRLVKGFINYKFS